MSRRSVFVFPLLTLLLLMAGLALLARTAPPASAQSDADLRVLKYSKPTNEVQAGEQFTYTIIVDNLGPISATNVVITDTLVTSDPVDPNGCSIAVRTDGGALDEFSCNFALSTGVFDLGTFGANHLHPRSPDDMGRIIVTINATANDATDLTNVTTVTSDTPDPNMDNNVAVDTLSVTNTADLRILKFSSPTNEVQAGEQFTYTIIVDNLGPGVAENVVITDTLVTSGPVDANGCSIAVRTDGGAIDEFSCNFALSTGVFDLGTFGANHLNPRSPNDMGRIIITINATANDATDLTSVTTVTSATLDPHLGNNVAVDTLSVINTADLRLLKFSSPTSEVRAGEQFTYTILVDNLGPGVADNVVITDTLVTSGAVDPNGCSIAVRTDGGAIDEFDCNFALSSGVFDLGTFGSNHLHPRSPNDMGRIIITINATANEPTDMTNVTTVTSATPDPHLDDNLVVTTLSVIGVSDMALNKSAVGQVQMSGQPAGNYNVVEGEVSAGALLTYTLAITNQGPSKAENVGLSDALPDTVAVINVAASRGNCRAGPTVTCGLGTLPGGAGATVTVTVRPDAGLAEGTVINNGAHVRSDYFDPDNGNNLHTASVEVLSTPDLWITKEQTPQTVYEGDITYRITAGNDGPSDSPFSLISDTLPVAVTPLSWDCVAFGGASCPASGFSELWEADLPVGGYVIISVHGTLTSAQPVVNTATIATTSGNSDLYATNNTATVVNKLNAIYVPITVH